MLASAITTEEIGTEELDKREYESAFDPLAGKT
jgi:hypothetical protein